MAKLYDFMFIYTCCMIFPDETVYLLTLNENEGCWQINKRMGDSSMMFNVYRIYQSANHINTPLKKRSNSPSIMPRIAQFSPRCACNQTSSRCQCRPAILLVHQLKPVGHQETHQQAVRAM